MLVKCALQYKTRIMQVPQIKHQCAHSNLFGYHDKKHKFGWALMYPKFLFLSYHVYHIAVKIVSKMLYVTLYHFLIIYGDMTLIFATTKKRVRLIHMDVLEILTVILSFGYI
jgi:hypothetical protein